MSRFLLRYWLLIVVTVGLVAFQSVINLYLPDLMSNIVDKGVVRGDTAYIWQVGRKMLLYSLLAIVASILASYTSSVVSMGVGRDLREAMFSKVTSFSMEEMNKFSPSSLLTRTTNDVVQIQQALVMVLRMVVMAPVMAVGSIIMAVQKDAKLTGVLFVSLPVMLGGLGIIAGFAVPWFKSLQRKIDNLNTVVRERITGIRVIRAFNKEDREMERFSVVNDDLVRTALKINRIAAILFPYMMIVMNYTMIFIIWFGAKQIDAGKLQVGQMMAVMQYAMQTMFSFIMISVIFIFLPRASVSARRIKEVLSVEPRIKENAHTTPTWYESNQGEMFKGGVVEFDNVSFVYPGAAEPVLKDITFTALPGKVTAIIGATGSGKTTLLNLIPRLYDVSSGSVKIDGVDVREIPFAVLQKSIGYATQRAYVFSGTIRENIRFGRDWVTDEMVERAAEIAQVMEFADKYPEKLDHYIEQAGVNLSGGQKQRISIARAIAGQPRIYLFDDTFSALDFKTDAKIRLRLFKEVKDATVIIVAQRVATIMHADQIIVLHNGRVVGIGKHHELLESCEIYRDIVASQLDVEEFEGQGR
ncbi:ABC transporter ATP-binding protein [Fervidobacterium thailandense]|uniref:Multidrug ABC transporter ATP-binding protein n=1 Tax=Fervidobacterium thailandense TaxID=1008305 RepID=A0A1E3G1U3_9BACT|nr:ABC transporter ATP-binding protein [Fervidobacterium thailandense]ODN30239.1 multidrug ABC transporter ATP-binding protein [Fervidobacterium thailandense]